MTGQPQRLATVSAMTECVIVRIAKADITRVIHEEPAFAELFIAHLLLATVVSRRIWSINCLIRARNARHGPFCFWPILARKVAGVKKSAERHWLEMLGTTRSRVSFFMNKFRALGLIDYNGRIEVRSSLWNLVLHDRPQIKTKLLSALCARRVRAKRKRPGNRGAPKFQPVRASGSDLGRFDLQKLTGARDWDRPRLHRLRDLAHEVDV